MKLIPRVEINDYQRIAAFLKITYIIKNISNEKILELDNNGGCVTLWRYLMPLNQTLKNGKFYVMYIFPQ